jgi:hypothetical protein
MPQYFKFKGDDYNNGGLVDLETKTYLDLRFYETDETNFVEFMREMKNNKTIKSISVDHLGLRDQAGNAIAEMLKTNQVLNSLDLLGKLSLFIDVVRFILWSRCSCGIVCKFVLFKDRTVSFKLFTKRRRDPILFQNF